MVARNLFGSVPNLITVGRLLLVPVTVALLVNERWGAAFAAFLIAGVSDAIDGFLARRYDLHTELGAHLDPLADKTLLVSIYVWLAIDGVMPATIAILVVSRDVMIVGAVIMSWVLDRPMKIAPLWVSKANTAAQIAFAAVALGERALDVHIDWMREALLWSVATLTIASTGAYLHRWLRHMGAL